jgi:hypothetical protein
MYYNETQKNFYEPQNLNQSQRDFYGSMTLNQTQFNQYCPQSYNNVQAEFYNLPKQDYKTYQQDFYKQNNMW